MDKLLPTSLVGSYAQPDWLIDRADLAGRFPPRVRARELWRVADDHLDEAQDDATILANGHILVFDNGLQRGWSRVLEVDPLTDRIVWEYGATDRERFYSRGRGNAQRLPNGNTLIADSDNGRAFEVTHEGDLVWEFRNPFLVEKQGRNHRAPLWARRYAEATLPGPG